MKLIKIMFFSALMSFAVSGHAASLLGQAPSASQIYTADNGLEWVYAGPCAGLQPSCGVVSLHSGFDFATEFQWIDSFGDLNGLIDAFNLNSFDQAMCAAPQFNTVHNHCDAGDALQGYIWGAPVGIAASLQHALNSAAETFLVRVSDDQLSPVPLPAALWLFGSAMLGFVGFSRKKGIS